MRRYLYPDNVLTVPHHEKYLVLPTELVADLLYSFERDSLASAAIFSLEDVAWIGGEVPKQPEPRILMML